MNATITKSVSIGSVSFSENTVVNASNTAQADPTVPVAQPATLTTRTSATVGILTMTNVSHGIVTGQRMDVYFSGGRRRGVTVGTVSGTSVPFSLGAGDNLPIATSAIVAATPVYRPFGITGDSIDLLAVQGPAGGHSMIVFVDVSVAELLYKHNQGGVGFYYYPTQDDTNPLAGVTVAGVYLSHDNVSTASQVLVGAMCN